MPNTTPMINIYADESCHLQNPNIAPMYLGCVWTDKQNVKPISEAIKALKMRHSLRGELKWVKVSKKNINFYLDLVELFFHFDAIHFRILVVPDKSKLDHKRFNDGSPDKFYYKMFFWLLTKIISPDSTYNIYLDTKDTRGARKIAELRKVLCFDKLDFEEKIISDIRNIRSHESQLLQLADFFIGAVAYRHRGIRTSDAKLEIIRRIEKHTGHSLSLSTSPAVIKFNTFVWSPRK